MEGTILPSSRHSACYRRRGEAIVLAYIIPTTAQPSFVQSICHDETVSKYIIIVSGILVPSHFAKGLYYIVYYIVMPSARGGTRSVTVVPHRPPRSAVQVPKVPLGPL